MTRSLDERSREEALTVRRGGAGYSVRGRQSTGRRFLREWASGSVRSGTRRAAFGCADPGRHRYAACQAEALTRDAVLSLANTEPATHLRMQASRPSALKQMVVERFGASTAARLS